MRRHGSPRRPWPGRAAARRGRVRGLDHPPAVAGRRAAMPKPSGWLALRWPPRPGPLWLSHLPADEAERARPPAGRRERRPRAAPAPGRHPALARRRGQPDHHRDGARRAPRPTRRARRLPAAALPRRRLDRGRWPAARPTASGWRRPPRPATLRQRAIAAGHRVAGGGRLALSPYTINGRKRWFLEPPHMQSSLVFLPGKETAARDRRRGARRAPADHRDGRPSSLTTGAI